MTNRIRETQFVRNRDSRERWALFAPHRARVTEELVRCAESAHGRLCILGAGNCNDFDLNALKQSFGEIHLVDLDADEVLADGVARQGLSIGPAIQVHGSRDLSGMIPCFDNLAPIGSSSDPTTVSACMELADSAPAPPLPGPFDVVASVCLLTQIIESGVMALGADHPKLFDLIFKLRTRHLRLLAELTRPGGRGVLITDVVSSASWAAMANVPDADFPNYLAGQLKARNFFHGVNPLVLNALLQTDAMLQPWIARSELARPWRWNFGPRYYAVCAIRYRRSASDWSLGAGLE